YVMRDHPRGGESNLNPPAVSVAYVAADRVGGAGAGNSNRAVVVSKVIADGKNIGRGINAVYVAIGNVSAGTSAVQLDAGVGAARPGVRVVVVRRVSRDR